MRNEKTREGMHNKDEKVQVVQHWVDDREGDQWFVLEFFLANKSVTFS